MAADSNIIEYIEINNSGLGTINSSKDTLIITDYDPVVPIIRPPYTAENVINKQFNLLNPNEIGYPSTLAVYNALLPLFQFSGSTVNVIKNCITKSEIDTYTGNTYSLINSISGNTYTKSEIDFHTGDTSIHYNQNNIEIIISQVSGLTNTINDLYVKTNISYPTFSDLPIIGNVTGLYLVKSTNTFYVWNGVIYLPLNLDAPVGAFTNDISSGTGWNATTNTPTIVSSIGNEGDFAIVSVAGTTNINGINNWEVNDIIWYDIDNLVWRQINNQTEQVKTWTLSNLVSGILEGRVACFDNLGDPVLCETQTSALFVGDYANDFPSLITASNWLNNIAGLAGTLGDRAIGIDELGSISESFYTQYGWARDFINSFITDVTLIASLQTTGNWTSISDIISTYNASKGDRGQTYYADGIFYFCLGNASHTWLRYGNLNTVIITDTAYIPKPQIEVGKLDNSTFVIEAKYDIVKIVVEAETTTAGNLSIGSADGLDDIVASVALPVIVGTKKQLTYLINSDYPTLTNRTMYINIDSIASVKIHIIIQKMFE